MELSSAEQRRPTLGEHDACSCFALPDGQAATQRGATVGTPRQSIGGQQRRPPTEPGAGCGVGARRLPHRLSCRGVLASLGESDHGGTVASRRHRLVRGAAGYRPWAGYWPPRPARPGRQPPAGEECRGRRARRRSTEPVRYSVAAVFADLGAGHLLMSKRFCSLVVEHPLHRPSPRCAPRVTRSATSMSPGPAATGCSVCPLRQGHGAPVRKTCTHVAGRDQSAGSTNRMIPVLRQGVRHATAPGNLDRHGIVRQHESTSQLWDWLSQ